MVNERFSEAVDLYKPPAKYKCPLNGDYWQSNMMYKEVIRFKGNPFNNQNYDDITIISKAYVATQKSKPKHT